MDLRDPRWVAFIAIVLTSLNLRAAVTSISPLIPRIQEDLALSGTVVGLIGMIPTALFAVSAFALPWLSRRLTVPQLLLVVLLLTAAGQVLRVLGPSTTVLLIGSVVTMFAVGATNAAMPLATRTYFPDRVPLLSTVYLTASQLTMAGAPLVAVPLADAAANSGLPGWQVSLGSWALLALVAALAWLPLLTDSREPVSTGTTRQASLPVGRTSIGIGLAMMLGFTSFATYSMMIFVPQIFVAAGASAQFSALMLAYWSILGIPLNVLGPWLVGRFANPFPAVLLAVTVFIIGNTGLLLAPMSAPWLWVTLSGLGPLTFPMALTLINLRARTLAGATGLSSFGQGLGYTVACLGPLLTGVIQDLTGSLRGTLPIFIIASLLVATGSFFVTRNRRVEDQLRT